MALWTVGLCNATDCERLSADKHPLVSHAAARHTRARKGFLCRKGFRCRRRGRGRGALALEALDVDLEVELAHAAYDGLLLLLVVADAEGRVLLLEAAQRLAELVGLVALGVGFRRIVVSKIVHRICW